MANVLIEPIETKSRGGYPVKITGIDPNTHDCLIGEITTPGMGTTKESWDLSGYMRGGTDKCNLDLNDDDFSGVSELAKKLGAP